MMTTLSRFPLWRLAFLLAGLAVLLGPRHPGTERPNLSFVEAHLEMLAHPDWIGAHLTVLASWVLLLAGLVLLWRREQLAGEVRKLLPFAMAGAALAIVEMAFHTAAAVDLEALRAGDATPILTTHLWFAVVSNPLLGFSLAVLAVKAGALRALGSPWVAWLGALGGITYGAAAPLTILTRNTRFAVLFVGLAVLALWFVLVSLWPVRAPAVREDLSPSKEAGASTYSRL
jgi:hypothetical protein